MATMTVTHHTVSVFICDNSDPVVIENAENGKAWGDLAWADFQAGNTVKFPGSDDYADCVGYIPYAKICMVMDCPTTTSSTVVDATCVEEE